MYQIEQIPINKLKNSEYNPRGATEQEIRDLKNSIQEFGFIDPIIVNSAKNRKNIIIGGHFRIHIAKEIGFKQAPVIFVKIPDIKKEQELNLRLNKNLGHWDYDLLANFDEMQLKEIGFDEGELDKIFQLKIDPIEDEIPAFPKKVKTKRNYLYKLGNHRLLCGDATKKEDVAKLMEGKKADMVFTDPPYGLGGYGGRNKMELKGDDKDVSIFYSVIPKAKEIYVWGLFWSLSLLNFKPKDAIIWKKNNFGLGRGYRNQYEICFYAGDFKGSDSDVLEVRALQ